MAGYYYLMAQLPTLSDTAAPGISYKDFLLLAERFLSAGDMKTLNSLSLIPPKEGAKGTGSAVIDSWYQYERALRFSLARARAAKLKRDAQAGNAGLDSSFVSEAIAQSFGAAAATKAAVEIDSPMEAELSLDKARFACARDLGAGHFYDSEAVFAYALMLLIKERSACFSAEAGRAEYMRIYNSILASQDSGG